MTNRLLTESGEYLVGETIAGVTNASNLNDTSVRLLIKEDFSTNPLTNGWLIGSGWSWNAGNGNMEIV